MFGNLFKHPLDVAAIILRVGIVVVFLFHGYLKVQLGNESGARLVSGVSQGAMTAVGWVELACAGLIAIGLFTRPAALILIVLQAVAIVMVSGSLIPHVARSSPDRSDYLTIGAEFNVALIAMCLSLFVLGAGHLALDQVIRRRMAASPPTTTGRTVPAAG